MRCLLTPQTPQPAPGPSQGPFVLTPTDIQPPLPPPHLACPPHPSPHGERLIPIQFPLKQHVVPLGWELYTANMLMATSWSMRVLPMGGGLCCSSTWNSLRTSSATAGKVSILQTERERLERAGCALGCGVGSGHGTAHVTSPGEGGIPRVLSPIQEPWGMKVQAASLERGSEGLLCDRQAAFFWQENTAFMSHF